MTRVRLFALFPLLALSLAAQPKINTVVLGTFDGAPSDVSAPGALTTMFGSGLQSARVYVGGVPAAVSFTSDSQVNFQVPEEWGPQSKIDVWALSPTGLVSNRHTIELRQVLPGIFRYMGSAIVTHADYGLVTSARQAAPGEALIWWCTGFGQARTGSMSGVPGRIYYAAPNLVIGGQPAAAVWSGEAPGFPGLAQLVATVPAGAHSGEQSGTLDLGSGYKAQFSLWVR